MTEILTLRLPANPRQADAVRAWCVDRGFELVEVTGRYPRICRADHLIESEADEVCYRNHRPSCRECGRIVRRATDQRRRARRRAMAMESHEKG